MASSLFNSRSHNFTRVRIGKRCCKKNVVAAESLPQPQYFLFGVARQTNDKLCISGFRGEPNDAVVLLNDALNDT